MKKNIYFIISSIIQILVSWNVIANSNKIFIETMNTIKKVYSMFPLEFQDRITSMMSSTGIYFIIIPAIICVIVNTIILLLSFDNKITKKKGIVILLSVICIIFSSSNISLLLTIANLIILSSIKKEDNKIVKEKKKLPEVVSNKHSKKELISSISIFLIYFSQFIWSDYIPKDNKTISILVSISFYTIMFSLVFILFGKKIVNDFKKLIKNFNTYVEYDIPRYGFMILSFLVVNLICILITKNATSVNQSAVESLPKIILFVLAVLWAPIVEETIFRGTIKYFINTKWVYILISAFVFGFLHAMGEESIFKIIFTTIPYATLGGWLAYIYYDTDNLANNIMIHAIWNLFAVILSFFISFII